MLYLSKVKFYTKVSTVGIVLANWLIFFCRSLIIPNLMHLILLTSHELHIKLMLPVFLERQIFFMQLYDDCINFFTNFIPCLTPI